MSRVWSTSLREATSWKKTPRPTTVGPETASGRTREYFPGSGQAALDRGRALLVGVTLVGFTRHVGSQTQFDVGTLHGVYGVSHGHHAAGVDGANLLHDAEKIIDFAEHSGLFVRL